MTRLVLLIAVVMAGTRVSAQVPEAPPQFEVVSIKRSTADTGAGGIRTLPDGTMVLVNQPIRSILGGASPEPAQQVIGYPSWVETERYDITAKPPAGSTREQRSEMLRQMFAERMKLVAHVEQREQDAYALVVARDDGRLGPQLRLSTLDCSPPPTGTPPPPPRTAPLTDGEVENSCSMVVGNGRLLSGGLKLDVLSLTLRGLAGRVVTNRTGLDGFYAIKLMFAERRVAAGTGGTAPADPADAPDIFTALREQLGLQLRPERITAAVFVIDSIERPSEN